MSVPEKKHRGSKVTAEQNDALINFLSLKENNSILTMKPHPLKPQTINNLWEEAAKQLNAIPGPKKSAEDWRRYFVDLKCRTKRKAREFKQEIKETGGGEKKKKSLTDQEEKLMGLIGWVSVSGTTELDEIDPDPEQPQRLESTDDSHSGEINIDAEQRELDAVVEPEPTVQNIVENPIKNRKRPMMTKQPKTKHNKRNYKSSESVVLKSAEIYAEASLKLNSALTHIGDGIFALAAAIENRTSQNGVQVLFATECNDNDKNNLPVQ